MPRQRRETLPFLPPTLPHRCHFLPLLPPITRNVKLRETANRLELGIRAEDDVDHRVKSGKNGNVDQPTQHCHSHPSPAWPDVAANGSQARFEPPASWLCGRTAGSPS